MCHHENLRLVMWIFPVARDLEVSQIQGSTIRSNNHCVTVSLSVHLLFPSTQRHMVSFLVPISSDSRTLILRFPSKGRTGLTFQYPGRVTVTDDSKG